MNTPAHLVLNLTLLGRREPRRAAPPVLLGALLPDLPMFLFYAVERLGLGRSEAAIWGERYFNAGWQAFFDVFNSLPFILVLGALGLAVRSRFVALMAASMLLHIAFDLPLHHDDGHHHLFPFSSWRFESPLSYWDPAHYGNLLAPAEGLLVLVCCTLLWNRYPGRTSRVWLGATAAVYASVLILAWVRYAGRLGAHALPSG